MINNIFQIKIETVSGNIWLIDKILKLLSCEKRNMWLIISFVYTYCQLPIFVRLCLGFKHGKTYIKYKNIKKHPNRVITLHAISSAIVMVKVRIFVREIINCKNMHNACNIQKYVKYSKNLLE